MINGESFIPDSSHRRAHSRLSTQIPAVLLSLHGKESALLLDLSLSGAHIRIDLASRTLNHLKIGGNVELEWGNKVGIGEIAWMQKVGHSFDLGLQFFDPLLPRTLTYTRELHDRFWRNGGFRSLTKAQANEWQNGIGNYR